MLKKLKNIGGSKREKKEILINIEPLETRVAVLENGKLDNFKVRIAGTLPHTNA